MFEAILICGLVLGRALAAPTAEEIISQVKARSAEGAEERNKFAYQRVSRVDYLDDEGEVKRKTERVYEVAPIDGQLFTKLIQVNGRPATSKEETSRSAARDTGDKSRGLALGDDLLSRYEYQLCGEETVGGRPAWLLDFTPKPGAEENGFFDKLLNSMHGKMWVDRQDFQLARVDVHLGKKVSFFGGIAGAIEKLDLQLVQRRVDSDAWLAEAMILDLSGRKLFSPIRLRCFETCSGFHKVLPLAGK